MVIFVFVFVNYTECCAVNIVVLLADEPDFPAIVSQLIYDYSTKCVRVCFSFMLCCMSTITLCFEHHKVIFIETQGLRVMLVFIFFNF